MNHKKIRMIFRSLFFPKRVRCALTVFLFLSNQVLAVSTLGKKNIKVNSKPQVFVRDYKYFRKFYYKDAEFTVNKTNSKIKNLVFTKGDKVLSVNMNNQKTNFQLMVPGKTKRHFILTNYENGMVPKIGYFSVNRKKYFNSVMPKGEVNLSSTSQMCSRTPNWSFGELSNIVKVLGENKSDKFTSIDPQLFLDDKSCDTLSDEVVDMTSEIGKLFKNNATEMFACLQSEQAQKVLSQDKNINVLMNANIFVARMTRFLDENSIASIEKNSGQKIRAKSKSGVTNSMKIMCAPNKELEGKSACFIDDNENPAIIVDLEKIKKTAEFKKTKFNDEIGQVLIHEFYHTSFQQIETPQKPGCIDEQIINNLESLCSAKQDDANNRSELKIDAIQIAKNCEAQEKLEIAAKNPTVDKGNGDARTAVTNDIEINNTIIRGGNTVAILDTVGIQKINDAQSTLSSAKIPIAEAVVPQEGAKVPVVNNPIIENAASSLYSSLSQNTNGLTSVLSKALKLPATNANAKMESTSANSNAANTMVSANNNANNSRGIASVQSQTSTISPMSKSEIIASQFGIDDPKSKSIPLKAESNNVLSSDDKTTNSAGAVLQSGNADRSKAKTSVLNRASTQKSSALAVVNNQDQKIENASQNTNAQAQVQNRQIASVQETPAVATKITDTRILQTLTGAKEIKGNTYTEVVKMYRDPSFKADLKLRGIAIKLNDSKGTVIGSENANIIFNDSGKILKRQNTK
jgi:hypothetical protein